MISDSTTSNSNKQQDVTTTKTVKSGIQEPSEKVFHIKLSPNSHFLSGIVLISIWFIVVIMANSGVHDEANLIKMNKQHHLMNNEPPKSLHTKRNLRSSSDSDAPEEEKKKMEKDNNKTAKKRGKNIKDFITDHVSFRMFF